jgi:hypothetical protein
VGSTFTLPIIGGGALARRIGRRAEDRWGDGIPPARSRAGLLAREWLEVAERLDTAEVDVEPTRAFPGKRGRLGVLEAAAFQLSADPGQRTISASGIQLSLTAQSAQTFNEAFAEGKGDFAAGEAVGVLGFVAEGQ